MRCPKCNSTLYTDSDAEEAYNGYNEFRWLACSNSDCDYTKNIDQDNYIEPKF